MLEWCLRGMLLCLRRMQFFLHLRMQFILNLRMQFFLNPRMQLLLPTRCYLLRMWLLPILLVFSPHLMIKAYKVILLLGMDQGSLGDKEDKDLLLQC